MSDNRILNGCFNEGIYQYDPSRRQVLLKSGTLNQWTLLSWSGHEHNAQFLASDNNRVRMPLHPDLQNMQPPPGFAGLNASNNSGLIFQTFDLPTTGEWEVTWYASADQGNECLRILSYYLTVQVGRGVLTSKNVDLVEDGFFHRSYDIYRSQDWQKYSLTFKNQFTGTHYLSFLGDKDTGNCGALITGISVHPKVNADDIKVEVEGGKITVPLNSCLATALRFAVTKLGKPLPNYEDITITLQPGTATGCHLVSPSSNRIHTSTDTSGYLYLPAGSLCGGAVAGYATLSLELAGKPFLFNIEVEMDKSVGLKVKLEDAPGGKILLAPNACIPAALRILVSNQDGPLVNVSGIGISLDAGTATGTHLAGNEGHGLQVDTDGTGHFQIKAGSLCAASAEGKAVLNVSLLGKMLPIDIDVSQSNAHDDYEISLIGGGHGAMEVSSQGETALELLVTRKDTGKPAARTLTLTLDDSGASTGVRFLGNKDHITVDSDPNSGIGRFGLLGAGKAGPLHVRVEASGAKPLDIAVQAVQQLVEEHLKLVHQPKPSIPGAHFDSTIRVQVERLVGGAFAGQPGLNVVFTIKTTPSNQATAPYFLVEGHPRYTIDMPSRDAGLVESAPIIAGVGAGTFIVEIAGPRSKLEVPIMVRGISKFVPNHANYQASIHTVVEGQWYGIKALYEDGSGASNQPIEFVLDDDGKTGSLFVASNSVTASGASVEGGQVKIPAIKIGATTGEFTVVITGLGGTPRAEIQVEVNATQIPSAIEFDGLPDLSKALPNSKLKIGAISVHVTDIKGADMIAGHVTFAIQDHDTHTKFSNGSSSASVPITEGTALCPVIMLGASGTFEIIAAIDDSKVAAIRHTFTIP